jgi:hypothetical protein
MLLGFCTALAAIFSAFCPLWVAYQSMMCSVSMFAGCGLLFGLYGWIYAPLPHPKTENAKSGLPFQKFFLKFYFFYFCICNRGLHEPVRVVSSFAGFFSCKRPKIEYFLDVGVVIGCRNAKFGYF